VPDPVVTSHPGKQKSQMLGQDLALETSRHTVPWRHNTTWQSEN